MANFSLHILEYTDSTAGSSKGYKHSSEAIEKMRNLATGRKHTDEVKELMSKNRQGVNNYFYNKKHSPETIERFKEIVALACAAQK